MLKFLNESTSYLYFSLPKFHKLISEVSSVGTIGTNSFKLDFSILYERLCCTVEQQPPMLLLYVLLHRNSGFRNYVLSRINLERLVSCEFMIKRIEIFFSLNFLLVFHSKIVLFNDIPLWNFAVSIKKRFFSSPKSIL